MLSTYSSVFSSSGAFRYLYASPKAPQKIPTGGTSRMKMPKFRRLMSASPSASPETAALHIAHCASAFVPRTAVPSNKAAANRIILNPAFVVINALQPVQVRRDLDSEGFSLAGHQEKR